MSDDRRHSLTQLADLAGVTPRTVRYYLAQGLLPAVGQTGPGSKYDAGHLARLRLIRRLQAEHLPLAEIRRRLDGLTEEEIRDLAGGPEPAAPVGSALDYLRTVLAEPSPRPAAPARLIWTAAPSPAPGLASADEAGEAGESSRSMSAPVSAPTEPAPSTLERSQWERIALAPDIELHIRRPLARAQNKQVDRLVTIARELLEEERP